MATDNTKTRRTLAYHGTGYEVILHNVPMLKAGGAWVLNVSPEVIDGLVFGDIPRQNSRLTGYQVRFIRDYAGLTLKAFAARFGVTHAAVKRWENAGEEPTNMAWSTEKDIRLFVLCHAGADAYSFQACYEALVAAPSAKRRPVHIDVESLAVA